VALAAMHVAPLIASAAAAALNRRLLMEPPDADMDRLLAAPKIADRAALRSMRMREENRAFRRVMANLSTHLARASSGFAG